MWQSNCAVCVKRHDCETKKKLEKSNPVYIAIGCSDCVVEQPTNADRIRAMSDAKLARWINFHTDCENCPNRKCEDPYTINPRLCVNSLLDWLKSPADKEDGDEN